MHRTAATERSVWTTLGFWAAADHAPSPRSRSRRPGHAGAMGHTPCCRPNMTERRRGGPPTWQRRAAGITEPLGPELPARCLRSSHLQGLETVGQVARHRPQLRAALESVGTDEQTALHRRAWIVWLQRAVTPLPRDRLRARLRPELRLFSIGFNVATGQLDGSSTTCSPPSAAWRACRDRAGRGARRRTGSSSAAARPTRRGGRRCSPGAARCSST